MEVYERLVKQDAENPPDLVISGQPSPLCL